MSLHLGNIKYIVYEPYPIFFKTPFHYCSKYKFYYYFSLLVHFNLHLCQSFDMQSAKNSRHRMSVKAAHWLDKRIALQQLLREKRAARWLVNVITWMLSADWSEGSPHSCHSKRYPQEPEIKQTISARPQLIDSLSVSSNSRIIQNIPLLNAVYCHVKRGRRRPSVNEYKINLTRSDFHRLADRRLFSAGFFFSAYVTSLTSIR